MLQFLPYALAAYGGYKGYRASKDAGGSPLQRLLAGATGAYLGYQGGKLVPGVEGAGFGTSVPSFSQLGPIQSLSQTSLGPLLGLGGGTNLQTTDSMGNVVQLTKQGAAQAAARGVDVQKADQGNMFQRLLMRKRFEDGKATGEMEFSPGKVAAAIGAGTYLSGAFEPKPIDVFQPTYNLAVADLQKQRGGFKYIDPVTGEEKVFEQPYIPEADPANRGDFRMGPYAIERSTFNEGGLAEIKKFNQGGINYLPSKVTHDENDVNNYVRATGYVEDGSGTGDKDEDTMLAQLADGEFVTRADGVLGAGIIAGGNPNSFKDMREKGAQYFYEQQKRYKRVFDLLQGSRNAKAKAN